MIAILSGRRGDLIKQKRDSNFAIEAILLDANGAPVDVTGFTVTLEVYENVDRSDTPISLAATLTAPTAGHVTVTVDGDVALANTSAKDYYAWVKQDDSGSLEYSDEFTILRLQ